MPETAQEKQNLSYNKSQYIQGVLFVESFLLPNYLIKHHTPQLSGNMYEYS